MLEDTGYTVNWVLVNQGLPGAATAIATGKRFIASSRREDRDRASPAYARKLAETLACLGVTGDIQD